MKVRSLFVAATLTACAAFTAQAQQIPRPTSMPMKSPSVNPMRGSAWGGNDYPSFDQLDKKGKGSLTRSDIPSKPEALRDLRMHFQEADRDHNGRLSPAEYATFLAAKSQSPEDAGG